MMLLSAWQPTQTFDPSKEQRVRTLYLPNAGEYRSIYWDKVPVGDASVLSGLAAPSTGSIFLGLGLLAAGITAAVVLSKKSGRKRR